MHWYHYYDTVPLQMPLKLQCFIQYVILKITKFNCILSAYLPTCIPVIKPGCASAMALIFSYNEVNHHLFTKLLF